MAECEAVDLDLSAMTASLQVAKANFAHIVFQDTEETYTVGADVACVYSVGAEHEASSRDRVGLYKVGWRSPDDFVHFEWSPVPENYTAGRETANRVVFPASKLPSDDGEFYQFCYVTAKGQVRGASSPFQFRKSISFSSSLDDLIEIEDENGELLIVKSKTTFLNEQLKKANEKCCQLKQDTQVLESEKEVLILSKQDLERKLQRQKLEEGSLRKQISEGQTTASNLAAEVTSLKSATQTLQDKILVVTQEKSEVQGRLNEAMQGLAELHEAKKSLLNEKDALLGQVKSLEAEKLLYQSHFTSSESAIQAHVQRNDELSAQLADEQTAKQQLSQELEDVKSCLCDQVMQLEKCQEELDRNKEAFSLLESRLSEAEAEISVREQQQTATSEEMNAVLEAYKKISDDLEVAKTEAEATKVCLENTKTTHLEERKEVTEQLVALTEQLSVESKKKKVPTATLR